MSDTPNPDEMTVERVRVARGWLEVVRLAERERRKDAGQPLIRLEPSGAS